MFSSIQIIPVLEFISDARTKGDKRQISCDILRMECLVNDIRIYTIEELKDSLNNISNGLFWLVAPLYHQGVMAMPLQLLHDSYDSTLYAICDGKEKMRINTNQEGREWELTIDKMMHVYHNQSRFDTVNVSVILRSSCDDILILFDED